MDLVSIRIITDDIERTVEFYEQATRVAAVRYTPVFADVVFPSFTLATGHTQTVQLFGENPLAQPKIPSSSNSRLTRRQRVRAAQAIVPERFNSPPQVPWVNRSLLLKDPDGNPVNFFTPVTENAIKKFSPDGPSLSSQKFRNRI